MSRDLIVTHHLDLATATGRKARTRLTSPRTDLLVEAPADQRDAKDEAGARVTWVFHQETGPFTEYERTVVIDPATDPAEVREHITWRLRLGVWTPLIGWLARRRLRKGDSGRPWWTPPDHLDGSAAATLAAVATLALVAGYLGTLISQTITFAADEFGADESEQGLTLAAVRIGVLVALVLVAVADRRGRRSVLVTASVLACVAAATGALAPSLAWLGVSQTVARGLSTTMGILIGIVAAEAMPRSSRAYAVSVLTLAAALGSGMAVWALPLADLGERAWRIIYVIPLAALPLVVLTARLLPESRRFVTATHYEPQSARPTRIALLAATGFLGALFLAPASQFLNEFLRTEQDFSAARIALFTLATNTPGGIGVFVGGRLADRHGRRIVGSVALVVGVGATVIMYLLSGWGLWAFSVIGALVGSATAPALGVYGPELFPTTSRGRANGLITTVAVVGSSVGLVLAGWMADGFGSFGPAMAVLAVGPLLVAVLVVTRFPETAHRPLEDINPEDRH